jgi:hypothetical protein
VTTLSPVTAALRLAGLTFADDNGLVRLSSDQQEK